MTIQEFREIEQQHALLGEKRVAADKEIQVRMLALQDAEATRREIVDQRLALQERRESVAAFLIANGDAFRCLRCGYLNEGTASKCAAEECGVARGQKKKKQK